MKEFWEGSGECQYKRTRVDGGTKGPFTAVVPVVGAERVLPA